MTKLTLYLNNSVEENASLYYEKAKKAKKKVRGAEEALQKSLDRLSKLKEKQEKEERAAELIAPKSKREWYEKFRWFVTSEGFLAIGGRDATTNEIVIKKYTDKEDIVFHTDMAGSPFFVVKANNKKIGEKTIKEAADATVTFSRAWKLGMQTTPVFYVKPEQVSKTAQSGEYLTRGAFVIRGRTNYVGNKINCAIGITKDNKIMGGPLDSIKANCLQYVEIEQGHEKPSQTAKKIQKRIGGEIDDIIKAMPSGGCREKSKNI